MNNKIFKKYKKKILEYNPNLYVQKEKFDFIDVIGVYGIPDDKTKKWTIFALDILHKEIKEYISIVPRTISITKEYYPEIYEQFLS